MGPANILLVRHPETLANEEGIHVARGDSPYSETGLAQVAALPGLVAAWRPDMIVTSPQRRALVPALATSSAFAAKRPLRVDADLAEYDVGEAEGLSHEEGVARGLIGEYDLSDPDCRPFAGGESVGEFAARCDAAWGRLLASEAERVAVFSHRGVIRYLLVHALGMPMSALWDFHIDPAEAARLALADGRVRLESLGALPGAGDDGTMHSNP